MPTASHREESQRDNARFLAVNLERADPGLAEAAQPALEEWATTAAKAGCKTTGFDRARILASTHQARCQAGQMPGGRCDACALSSAILLSCVVADEQHVHDLADAVGSLMRELSVLEEAVLKPLQRFEELTGAHREPRPLPGDLRRRSVAPRIRLVFSVARALLRDVPEILHQEAIYDDLRASPERKPGLKSDGVTTFLADFLKQKTGKGDRRVAEMMGLERDDIRQRRRRRAKHEPG